MFWDENGPYILRASRKLEDGTVIYAKDYGLKAFKIYINRPQGAK